MSEESCSYCGQLFIERKQKGTMKIKLFTGEVWVATNKAMPIECCREWECRQKSSFDYIKQSVKEKK